MKNSLNIPVIAENKDTFTEKRELFCYEYCIDLNATKAAIRAGYSHRTARAIGSRLLTKPYIQKRIREKLSNLAELAGISALRIVKDHEKIAFANMGDLRDGWMSPAKFESLTDDQKACIQEVTTTKGEYGDSLKVKLYDKQKSLDALAVILGFNPPIRNEVTGRDGQPLQRTITIDVISHPDQLSDEELDKRIRDLGAKISRS